MLCISALIYGQASVDSVIGISDNGLANQTSFNVEVNHEKAIDFQLGFYINSNDYEEQNIEIPIDVFLINLGAAKKIKFLSKKKQIATKISAGFSFGAEILNDGDKELENGALLSNGSGFLFGGYVGASSALKINQKFSAIIRLTNFFSNSDILQTSFIAGLGLRYKF